MCQQENTRYKASCIILVKSLATYPKFSNLVCRGICGAWVLSRYFTKFIFIVRSFPKMQQPMSQGTSFIMHQQNSYRCTNIYKYVHIIYIVYYMHCERGSKTIVKRLTTSVYCYRKDSVILEILASSVLTMQGFVMPGHLFV